MMNDGHDAILNDLLSRWHAWCKSYSAVDKHQCSPMFRQATSPRGWDSADDVIREEVDCATMEALDFHIGELPDMQRYTIQTHARNLHCGANVWNHPRLPKAIEERAVLLLESKNALTRRLLAAGVV